jgi:hypothetical protein
MEKIVSTRPNPPPPRKFHVTHEPKLPAMHKITDDHPYLVSIVTARMKLFQLINFHLMTFFLAYLCLVDLLISIE